MDGELTIAILREIRDEIRGTNTRIEALDRSLSGRIEALGGRVDGVGARVDAVEYAVRDLAEQMLVVTRYVKNVANRHDDAIEDLRLRVGKLETRGA